MGASCGARVRRKPRRYRIRDRSSSSASAVICGVVPHTVTRDGWSAADPRSLPRGRVLPTRRLRIYEVELQSEGMRPLLFRVRRWPRRVLASFWEPATQTELIQIVKMTAAAVGAWLLVGLIDLGQQFLAPWTAMLTVHATVYRSFSRGAQTVAATVFGIGLSYVVVQLIGVGAAAMGIVLLVGLLIARLGFHRDEGVTVATTALFVLTTGDTHDESALLGRFLATAIGVGVGVVVNIVAFPPLNHRSAQQQIDRINQKLGSLLSEMAGQMRSAWAAEESDSWIERTREMDDDLERAWTLVHFARESDWSNPRRRRLASSDQPAPSSARS